MMKFQDNKLSSINLVCSNLYQIKMREIKYQNDLNSDIIHINILKNS